MQLDLSTATPALEVDCDLELRDGHDGREWRVAPPARRQQRRWPPRADHLCSVGRLCRLRAIASVTVLRLALA